MKKILASFSIASIILTSCGNNNTPAADKNTATSKEDSLYNQVLALHDEAMPKMGKVMGLQKTLQAKIDSLDQRLATRKEETSKDLKARYEQVRNLLANAEKGMNDWMEHFNPDSTFSTPEGIIGYYESEKTKAAKMKDDMFAALDSAAIVLGEPGK